MFAIMSRRESPGPLFPRPQSLSLFSPVRTGFWDGLMVTILSVAWAYVTSLDRTLPVLLCALFLAGATTGALGRGGGATAARVDGALVREQRAAVHNAFDGV